MGLFSILLILAAVSCSLVAGFLFAFAVVAMPGIGTLDDRQFLRAFQVMDRVIQDNQPLFMLVWIGSVAMIIAAAVFGFWQLDGMASAALAVAALAYILGVQVPTVAINIPLNNHLQTLDLDAMDESALAEARAGFESRWNGWNRFRTGVASGVSAVLIILLFVL